MEKSRRKHKITTFKTLRNQFGYSIEGMRRELEKYGYFYSLSTIYKWDIGHRFPDIETLKVLAKIFRVPIETLLQNTEETKRLITNKTFTLEDKLCAEIRKSSSFYQKCLNLYIDYLKDNTRK